MSGSLTPTIQFNEIPTDWRVPGNFIEARPNYSNAGAFAWPAKALLVGYQTSAGTATLNTPVRIFTAQQARALFGNGSMLSQMCAAFLRANTTTPLWAAAIAEPAGTLSTQTLTFTGTPTAAGTIGVYYGGQQAQISVFTTDTPTTLAARLAAALNAVPDGFVTATSAAGVVTVSARHKGNSATPNFNAVYLNLGQNEATPTGLTLANSGWLTVTATDPDYSTLINVIASDWYTDVAIGPNAGGSNLSQWVTELARRYTAMGRLDMHAYVHQDAASYSAATTLGAAQNCPQLTITSYRAALSPPWVWAASVCGVASFQTTNDPARQLRGLVLPGVQPSPAVSLRWIESERDGLLRSGISTVIVERDGSVALDRVITTYQTTGGVADTSWLDITVPKTVSRIRHDWRTYVFLTYPRSKLADDGSVAAETDPSIVTPRAMHNAWGARNRLYAMSGWIQNEQQTVKESVFVRNATDRNRMDARLKVNIIGNLMVFAGALEFNQ